MIVAILCWLFGISAAVRDTIDFYGISMKEEIAAGHICALKDHPYLVTIRTTKDFRHHCGGTIISEKWVLTAAQCGAIGYEHGSLIAFAGSTMIHMKRTHVGSMRMQWALVSKVYLHRDYDSMTHRHDIALMELNYPIRENSFVKYMHLANYMHMLGRTLQDICVNGTIVGWLEENATDVKEEQPKPVSRKLSLHCVGISVIDYNECRQMYEKNVPNTMVCAFSGGRHFCKNNLGGPLICNNVQYGLVSTGSDCVGETSPEFFTRVDLYQDFIRAVILKKSAACNIRSICIYGILCLVITYCCK